MPSIFRSSAILFISTLNLSTALQSKCAPGGNFDLSEWNLQLPTGPAYNPSTIVATLLEGCTGYQDTSFLTDSSDGSLIMKVPGGPSSGCVTTKNSLHCRTELREINPNKSWDPNAATNRLNATLAVVTADDSTRGTVIGQIHIDDSVSTKPVCELYYNQNRTITMGVEQTTTGGSSIFTVVGHVPVGTKFDYSIVYEKNVLGVSINGGALQTLSTYNLNAPLSYFKAGNYNQGSSPSEVHFFALSVSH